MFNFFKNIFKNNKKDTVDIPSLKSKIKKEIKEELEKEIREEVEREIYKEISNKKEHINNNTTNTIENEENIYSQHKADVKSTLQKDNVIDLNTYRRTLENNALICPECTKELNGRKSSELNEAYYMICNHCNFVSKIRNNKTYRPSNTLHEINIAYKAFKNNGISIKQYSFHKNSERIDFK